MYLETLRSRIDTHAKDTTVHVTADEKSLWNSLASLFELVNIGTEESPLMAIRAKYGLFSNSFISARGSDPEAGQGGGGLDVQAMWYALAQPTTEKINASHIPNLAISKINGLQAALDSKLEGITKAMVEGVLTGTITSHNHDGMYAPLSGGLIPSQYLPSYVDDVVEYSTLSAFPATGESGKIYVALDTNLTYRWGGTSYVEISPSLALGHTSGTAYPGDEGAALAERVEAMKAITDLFGIDGEGNVYVKDNRGFWSNSFISARGSDPEAGSGGGSGVDMESVWYALGQPTNEKINVSHIPELTISKISGLQGELDSKLSGITSDMVKEALGYTPYDADEIGSASVAYAASAGKVAHALTINNDGGSSSASAKSYDGSAAVTINIPITLPASDVYSWAKAATKPSYTWSEIGGKPTEFTPAPHTHVKSDITDFPTSWAWSAITGKPSTLSGYGITDGVNAAEAAGHLTASVSGHKLTIGVASGYTIPTASQITLWDKVGGLFDVDEDGNVYVKDNRGFYGNSFISARGSDPEAGQGGGGSGVDMTSVWYALAQPTTEKINVSHIPALQQLSGTLTNAQLANSAISVAGVRVSLGGAVSTEQIASALTTAGYKLTDTIYTLPKATVSTLGGIKAAGARTSAITTTQGGTASGRYYGVELDSNGKAFVNVPWVNTTYSLSSFGITATAAEINKLDGLATTAKELGYVHGVTSNIQTQLDGKLSSGLGISTFGVSGTNLIGWTYNGATRSTVTQAQLRTMLGLGSNAYTSTAYLPLAGGAMTGALYARDLIVTDGYYLYGAKESGGSMVGFVGGRTQLGSIGASTTSSTLIRSITGHVKCGVNGALYDMLDSGNYTNYTVTKTGGGASGTWPISISGNAASATAASVANSAAYLRSTYTGSGGLQPPSYFNGMGLKVNMMNNPVSYCDVIVVNGYGGSGSDVPYINALAFQKTANAHGEVYHARGDYGGSSWGTWYKFLDEYNYAGVLDTRYVKKSGDTMNGTLTLLCGGNNYDQGIRINRPTLADWATLTIGCVGSETSGTSANTWLIGTPANSNSLIFCLNASSDQKGLCLRDMTNTGMRWNGYGVWHAGNDGSGSGLDADLLDGYQATSFNLATNLGACQDYGVYVIGLMQITDYTTAGNMANGTLIFIRQNGNNPAQKIIYSLSTQHGSNNVRFGYLTLSTNIYVRPCTFTYNGKKWAGFQVGAASSYSSGVVCVRDGLRLGERSTPFLLKYGVSNTGAVINSEVNSSVVINGADIIESGVYSNAFFGNATSATKLATARSIWGQTFDGTQGVDGHLYLGSRTYRLYFGTSGLTSFMTGEDSGYLSIKSANNTSAVSTLLRINLSNGVVSGSSISLSDRLAVSGAEGRGITYAGNHIRLKAATGGWAMGIEPYHNDDTTSFSHSVCGAFGGNANTINYNYYGGTYASPAMVILPNKMVGIGRTDPWYTLDVNGTIRASTGIFSDGYISCRGADSQAADASSGIDSNALWNVLGAVGTEKINASHLPDCSKTLTCSTAAGTAAKVVTCTGFQLTTGAAVTVRFTSGNSAASPSLNVNGTGAKGIRVYRGTSLVTPFASWNANVTVELTYNGTYWVITGNPVVYSLNAASASDSSGTYYRTARIFADGWKEYAFVTNASGNDRTLTMPYAFSSVNSMGVVVTLFGTSPGAGNVKSKSTSSVTVDFSTGTASTSKRGTVLCFGY